MNFYSITNICYKAHNIKIEINRRQFGSHYEMKTYLGVSMLVMVPADMLAHKLMAMVERMGKTNRDISDVWFFLEHHFPINKEIVKKRAGISFNLVVKDSVAKLEKLNNNDILSGVGELLTPNQKDWAKAKLRQETISLLRLQIGE